MAETDKNKRIYLDHAASTPVHPLVTTRVSEVISSYSNPSSVHSEGLTVRSLLEKARKSIAVNLSALPDEVVFTSGSTEGLNIAIQGVVKNSKRIFDTPHIVTSSIEHPSILETLRAVEAEGVQVTYLRPDKHGNISVSDIKDVLKKETVLVALSFVNSEIGNVLPVEEVARALRDFRRQNTGEKYPYFLLDATQAAHVLDLNVQALGVDLLVVDGGKMGGLKGSGVLFVSGGVEIDPILFGGGQERGLRPGTPNIMTVESLRLAFELSQREAVGTKEALSRLSGKFITKLKKELPQVIINGDDNKRSPHIVSVCFPRMDAEWIVLSLDAKGVSVSRGSACKSGKGNESEALRLIDPGCAESSIRFSFGKENTEEEVTQVVELLKEIVSKGFVDIDSQ